MLLPALMMVANAVAAVPTCTERLLGSTADAKAPSNISSSAGAVFSQSKRSVTSVGAMGAFTSITTTKLWLPPPAMVLR